MDSIISLSRSSLGAAFLVVGLAGAAAAGQEPLPVLKAHSRSVNVRDSGRLLLGEWTVTPELEFDTYNVRRSSAGKRVVFESDIETLGIDVEPGRTYEFIVQLEGQPPAHTRVSTLTRPFQRGGNQPASGPVSIPITIEHGKLHLHGSINGSDELDLIFDTGAGVCVLYPSGRAAGVAVTGDAWVDNIGAGGATRRQIGFHNELTIAGLRWTHEPILYVEKQADIADGVVGYVLFEDKVVEFDFDRMLMLVHDELPARSAEFQRTAMPYVGGLSAVDVELANETWSTVGQLLLDTGGTSAAIVNHAFDAAHGLRGALEQIGTGRSSGVGSATSENVILRVPRLRLAGFELTDVPINVGLNAMSPDETPDGVVCMDVLQRFNALLDYQQAQAYFKPNSHAALPFSRSRSRARRNAALAISITVVVALALVLRRRRRRAAAQLAG